MEIERRWLCEQWPDVRPDTVLDMEQGYVTVDPAGRVRREQRRGEESFFRLCLKRGVGLSRAEVEFSISEENYRRVETFIDAPFIRKEQRRYTLPGGYVLEFNQVDPDRPEGYFYAEVEFPTEAEALAWKPGPWARWLGREVTEEPQESMAAYWDRTRKKRA